MRKLATLQSAFDPVLEALPFLLTIVVASTLALWSVFGATYATLIPGFADDSFYYFQVAHNISLGQGSTFDGIHSTNGYHPLWMGVMVLVFTVARTKLEALVIIRVVGVLTWLASVYLVYRTARILKSVALFAAILPVMFWTRGYWLNGMETPLVLLLLFMLAYVVVRGERLSDGGRRGHIVLGVILSLLFLSRLDTVFFVGLFAGLTVWLNIGSERLMRLAWVPGLPLVCLCLYMGLSFAFFDTMTPVSGQAKALGEDLPNWSVFPSFLGQHPLRSSPLGQVDNARWFLVLFLPTAVLCARNLWMSQRADPPNAGGAYANFERFFLLLLAANMLQLSYFAMTSTWQLWPHYHYYVPVLLVCAPPILLNAVVGRRWQVVQRPMELGITLVLVFLYASAVRQWSWRTPMPPFHEFGSASVEVAKVLNAETEPDSVFAMGDRAGSLGFQLDRSLVHTEGLVNSKAYLVALRNGQVHSFLRKSGVDYVVYSGGPSSGGYPLRTDVVPDEKCWKFSEPKFGTGPKVKFVVCDGDLVFDAELGSRGAGGGMYNVWRYRPGINRDL